MGNGVQKNDAEGLYLSCKSDRDRDGDGGSCWSGSCDGGFLCF